MPPMPASGRSGSGEAEAEELRRRDEPRVFVAVMKLIFDAGTGAEADEGESEPRRADTKSSNWPAWVYGGILMPMGISESLGNAARYVAREAGEYAGGGRVGMLGHERLISMASGNDDDGEDVNDDDENEVMRVWEEDISLGEPVMLIMIVLGGIDGGGGVKEDIMERYSDRGRGL